MLLNSFYTILEKEMHDGGVRALISFDAAHPIFRGHFPGLPVVPGVCMMQIIREVLQEVTAKKLALAEGDNVKFMSVIDPRQHEKVNVSVAYTQEHDEYVVSASLFSGDTTFFKFKGLLKQK